MRIASARQTPVFFGSALNDFGVEPFLHALLTLAPSPAPRRADVGLDRADRSGFLRLRVQDPGEHEPAPSRSRGVPAHLLGPAREGHAGRSTRGSARRCGSRASTASSAAIARQFRRRFRATSSASSTPAASRSATRCTRDKRVQFPPIPQFPAEQFAMLRPADVRHKRFDEAVRQLAEEGLMQVFMPKLGVRHPIIGVIGRCSSTSSKPACVGVRHRIARSNRCRTSRGAGRCRSPPMPSLCR